MIHYALAHFIGDFLFQNDWMARGKKNSSFICTVHVALYMLPFIFVEASFLQLSLIFIQHWIQDRTGFIGWYCKKLGTFQGELSQNVLPWGHFVIDQIYHFIWLWIVFEYFC